MDSDLFFRAYVPPRRYKETLDKAFGKEWVEWEPETILQEIRRVFGATPTQLIQDKIFALQTYLMTHLFWDDPRAFENMILAFGDRALDPDLIKACLPEELAYGMTVADQIDAPRDTFVVDVAEYMRACHREVGVLVFHDTMRFAQPVYKGDMKRIAEAVMALLGKGTPPSAEIDHENPVQVQHAKAWDVSAYVQERLDRDAD
jgi:hypothetical protein